MAGKSKKQRALNPVSLGADAKAPMVSLKVKKQKKASVVSTKGLVYTRASVMGSRRFGL